jgi:hypothetical protein
MRIAVHERMKQNHFQNHPRMRTKDLVSGLAFRAQREGATLGAIGRGSEHLRTSTAKGSQEFSSTTMSILPTTRELGALRTPSTFAFAPMGVLGNC